MGEVIEGRRLSKGQRIKGLSQRLLTLREQRDKLILEARGWREERDKLSERLKSLRSEILEMRDRRAKLNEGIRELKRQWNEVNMKIHDKTGELERLTQEITVLAERGPLKSPQKLRMEVDNIEWRIQTTSLTLQEEKGLIERVKRLEEQLRIRERLDQLKRKRLGLQAELKALKIKAKTYREEIARKVREAFEIREVIAGKTEEAKRLEVEVDNAHRLFIQMMEKVKSIQMERSKILSQIKQLEEEVRKEEGIEREEREQRLREELKRQAAEKLKRGEKLTWEEFQVLTEAELT